MRDIIQSVIATESEARKILATAQAEADRIRSEAQQKGQDLVVRARQEARNEAEQMVEASVNEAGREKQERLARTAAAIETEVQLENAVRARAVDGALRCVCGRL